MEDYIERMIAELKDLMDKIDKLDAFIGKAVYENLDDISKFLLRQQLLAMRSYAGILKKRIDLSQTS